MDIMDIAKMALAKKIGGNSGNIEAVVGQLIGKGDSLDVAGLVGSMQEGGMGALASSFLGDGPNPDMSADQVKQLLGGDKVAAAAAKLGTDEGSLLDGLKDAIPQMVDKSSSGGSLLDSVGGVGGLAGMAKKFL